MGVQGLDAPVNDVENMRNTNDEIEFSEQTQEFPKPELKLKVTDDRMKAYLTVTLFERSQVVEATEIYAFLQENQITYGICYEDIEDFCKNRKFHTDLICAKGLDAVDGENGRIQYHFEKEIQAKPQELKDGSIDYHNLGLVQNVRKGDVLCSMIPPIEGICGMDIYKNTVAYKQGLVPDFPRGRNTSVTDDGQHLISDIDGYIEYKNLLVNVIDLYTVKGDIDHSSGNINFVGSVVVSGDVREGFRIKAGKDVIVRGMVEGAVIEAGNDIIITQGMNGMGKGKLVAGGNISGKFFENSEISCQKDVCAEIFINCSVTAGESIVVRGKRGSMIRGLYKAKKAVYAKTIGSDTYATTDVIIETDDKVNGFIDKKIYESKMKQLAVLREEQQAALQKVDRGMAQLAQSNMERDTKKAYLKALLAEKSKIQDKIQEIDKTRIAKEEGSSLTDYKVVALHTVYPGVKIHIGPIALPINQEYNNVKFYVDDGDIGTFPVTPADRGVF